MYGGQQNAKNILYSEGPKNLPEGLLIEQPSLPEVV
jgi:hypothetical protein